MKKLTRFSFRLSVIGMLLAVTVDSALSFCIIRSTGSVDLQTACCSGEPRWWHPSTLPVPITINRAGSKEAPGELTANAIRRAMQTWGNIPSAYFAFADAGLTDQNEHSANDGINIVIFDVEGNNFAVGTTVLAFSRTITRTDGLGYRAVDSDMVFNARDYAWGTGANPNEFDIETVALHEFGHHLGLDHAGGHRDISSANSGCGPVVSTAVMYYAVAQGSRRRLLQPDDIAGLTQIYPQWTIEGYVVDAISNAPITDVDIQLEGTLAPKDTITSTVIRTDATGHFFSPVLNNSFTITVSRFGYRFGGQRSIQFAQPENQFIDFRLAPLPTGSIRGQVRDATTGKPIQARIELIVNNAVFKTVAPDFQGFYEFQNLPISDPISTVYQMIRIEPALPYPPAATKQALVILENKSTQVNFDLEPAAVLIVDADGGQNYEAFFRTPLEKQAVSFVVWDVQRKGRPANALIFFPQKPVIWFTGNETDNVFQKTELDTIRKHLARGGSLFLSGQNIAEYLAASDSAFLQGVLRARWGGNTRDVVVHGIQTDVIGTGLKSIALGGGDGAKNQTSLDILIPQDLAVTTIVYDTTANAPVAGIRIDQAIPGVVGSRVVLFGFGLEGINSMIRGFATRDQVMANVLSWLLGKPTFVESDLEPFRQSNHFALFPNYPNPFNGTTLIRFWVPGIGITETVSLVVYDLLGREVRRLTDGRTFSAGEHTVIWDGRTDTGNAVASGVYLYKLQSGSFEQARKLLYIK